MAELLLELFSEEIPARMQQPMAATLKQQVEARLKEEALFFQHVKSFATPRRLVLVVDGLSLTQEDKVTERKGPRTDAPRQAIEGFIKSTGFKEDQLTKKTTDKGEFYFAIIEQKGRPTEDIVQEMLEDILPSLTWPKSMRWGRHEVRWVRPLKNICCMFGSEVLPISFGHLTANNQSYGHRFLDPEPFEVLTFQSYKDELKHRHVLLSMEDRKRVISENAAKLAGGKKLSVRIDEGLLNEVAGLVEWPEMMMGSIDNAFMHVPDEVLISSIRTHQKYFCVTDNKGALAPYFLVAANIRPANDDGAAIIAGNERVLRARLSDANFFWNQDLRQPLEARMPELDRIIFHAKLGTVLGKTKRITKLAEMLAVWIPHANLKRVERAGHLCKTDLVTEMVGEFPELQGIMGYYYAREGGEPDEVSHAIKEHYSPLGPEDTIPTAPVSIAIAIADKIDTLAGLFAIGEAPTGSKDPFALRRATLGIIRIILENKLSIPLRLLCEHALKQYPKSLLKHTGEDEDGNPVKYKVKSADMVDTLLNFFAERLKALLKAQNVRHDLIAAVFDGGNEDDLLRLTKRVSALEHFLNTEDGKNLLATYTRATNIVRIEEKKDGKDYSKSPSKSLLQQQEEETLFVLLNETRPAIKKALKEDAFEEAMLLLAELRPAIDAFFDRVTVNCDHTDVRINRLKILSQIRELLSQIANFELIEG